MERVHLKEGLDAKVTVIIPNYNHSKFLTKRIDSVLNQTYQNFEVILLDDKSTDDSLSIIKRYENHPKVAKVIINTDNSKSTFKQWNKGINEATGELIWIAESDDVADPDFLKTTVEKINENRNIGIVYTQSLGMDENDKIYGDCKSWTADLDDTKWDNDFFENGNSACSKYLIVKNIIPNASAVLFRKTVYLKAGSAPEDMKFCGDWLIWVRMLTISDLYYVSKSLNCFRFHSNTSREIQSVEKIKNKTNEDLKVIAYILKNHVVTEKNKKEAIDKVITDWISFYIKNINMFIHIFQLRTLFKNHAIKFPFYFYIQIGMFIVRKIR